jgi:acylphosphatase
MTETVRARVLVSGRVQGVFFRTETSSRASSRNVGGWVRNHPDGRVEAVFEGDRTDVESMIRFAQQGPRMAAVDNVEVSWEEPAGERGFSIR